MIVDVLNQKRGILMFYDGSKYIIYSTAYGVVAESTKIYRSENEEDEEKKVDIFFNICEWYGYWSLKNIITRGIRRFETKYVDKKVTFFYTDVKGGHYNIGKRLVVKLEEIGGKNA